MPLRLVLLSVAVCWILAGCGTSLNNLFDLLLPGSSAEESEAASVVFSGGISSDIGDAYTNCGYDADCFDRYIRASGSASPSNSLRKIKTSRGPIRLISRGENADGVRFVTYGEHPIPHSHLSTPPDYATLRLEYTAAGEVVKVEFATTRTPDGKLSVQSRER